MTAALTGLLGIALGSWLTFRFGLRQSRLEDAANRRLTWLEKAQAQLLAAAGDLQNARAAGLARIPSEEKERALGEAMGSVSRLRNLEVEAEAYLPDQVAVAVSEAVNDIVNTVAVASKLKATAEPAKIDGLLNVSAKLIYHAASRVSGEIRVELGLDELSREWRLYDQEIRELREEISPSAVEGRDSS